MNYDRDTINDLDKFDGICVIKFVDDERYYCRLVKEKNLAFGIGNDIFEAIHDAYTMAEERLDLGNNSADRLRAAS